MSATTRRAFVQGVMVTGATVGVACAVQSVGVKAATFASAARQPLPSVAEAFATSQMRAPIVSFHLDQPYLDFSGEALPYCPPLGARAAQPIAELSEAAFRCCFLGA